MTWIPMQGRVYIIHICLDQKGFASQQKDREQNCLVLETLQCSLHNESHQASPSEPGFKPEEEVIRADLRTAGRIKLCPHQT